MAAIELNEVAKSFGAVDVIKGVELRIEAGEFVTFVGPSGSGKSTLLRMIAGLETVTSGQITIDGADVTHKEPADRGIAMVFQSYALYPHMNIRDNIAFNLKLTRMAKTEIDERVAEAARILRLEALLDRTPAQLSGGQRQRVAIGRAIVRKPKVFLFDEPLSNLDAALRVQMRLEIERLHRTLGTTMVYVTHDQVEAMTLADRIVALEEGDIQQIGAPMDMYRTPDNLFVASFIGSPQMNLLQGEVVEADAVTATVSVAGGSVATIPQRTERLVTGERVTLGLRPEAMALSPLPESVHPNAFDGEVETVEQLGNISFCYVNLGVEALAIVQLRHEEEIVSGEHVRLHADGAAIHVYDSAGRRRK